MAVSKAAWLGLKQALQRHVLGCAFLQDAGLSAKQVGMLDHLAHGEQAVEEVLYVVGMCAAPGQALGDHGGINALAGGFEVLLDEGGVGFIRNGL
jgi:hypothetical protein